MSISVLTITCSINNLDTDGLFVNPQGALLDALLAGNVAISGPATVTDDPVNGKFRGCQFNMPKTGIIPSTVMLHEQLDLPEGDAPDIEAKISVSNGQILVGIPDVLERCSAAGSAWPIMIEQADGRLYVRLWNEQSEDPFASHSWKRATEAEKAAHDRQFE